MLLVLSTSITFGATINRYEISGNFVVNVLLNNEPVKEINGVVVIPFESEYEILIKNNNHRRAVATVTIDGSNISSYGDIVIPPYCSLKLERFITSSLNEGKKFKFVPLDNPQVDDPTREENGIIKVVFKLEKEHYLEWSDETYEIPSPYIWPKDEGFKYYWQWNDCDDIDLFKLDTSGNITTFLDSSSLDGATIGGSMSDQTFHNIDIETDESEFWLIEIKLKGI